MKTFDGYFHYDTANGLYFVCSAGPLSGFWIPIGLNGWEGDYSLDLSGYPNHVNNIH